MKTLIIPCAGKSNRFPNMKPKYMLTHPDGKLMIEKAIEHMNVDIFDSFDNKIKKFFKENDNIIKNDNIEQNLFKNEEKKELIEKCDNEKSSNYQDKDNISIDSSPTISPAVTSPSPLKSTLYTNIISW